MCLITSVQKTFSIIRLSVAYIFKKMVLQNHLLMIFYSTHLFLSFQMYHTLIPYMFSNACSKYMKYSCLNLYPFLRSCCSLHIWYLILKIAWFIVLFSWNVHFHVQFLHLQELRIRNSVPPRSKSITFCSRLRHDSIMKPWSWSPALMSVHYWSEGLSCHHMSLVFVSVSYL